MYFNYEQEQGQSLPMEKKKDFQLTAAIMNIYSSYYDKPLEKH